jgi:signal transduction histidine kinase
VRKANEALLGASRMRDLVPRLTFVGLALILALALIAPIVLFASTTLGTLDTGLGARTSAERARTAAQATKLVDQEIEGIEADLRLLADRPEILQNGRFRDAATMEAALADLLVRRRYSFVGLFDGTGAPGSALAAVAERGGDVLRGPVARIPVGAFGGSAGQTRALEIFDREVATRALAQQSGFVVSGAFPAVGSTVGSTSSAADAGGRYVVFVGRSVLAPRPPPQVQLDIVAAIVAAPRFEALSDRLRTLAAPGRTVSLLARDAETGEGLVVLASTAPGANRVDLRDPARAMAGGSGESLVGEGTERVVAFAPIPSRTLGQGPNWVITVMDDLAVTLGPERRLAEQIQGASLSAVVLAGVIAVALAFLLSLVERQRRTLSGLLRELELKRGEVEAASAAKSRFLASMSHELRTPLNSIIGFSEVMQMGVAGPITEKQRDYLGDVVGSGKHLLILINDVLDLSKVEAGKLELRPEDVDLARVVEQVGAVMRPLAERKRIQLTITPAEALGTVHHDPGRLRQILLNLASNAVKFTPEGGSVMISALRLDTDVEIAVRDSGIGLSEADLATIFDEFRQIDSAYARSQEGTGLGLALVKRFVELMGGSIAVTSVVGVGSTFVITLPLVQKVEAPAAH